jgi:hypothetical protein
VLTLTRTGVDSIPHRSHRGLNVEMSDPPGGNVFIGLAHHGSKVLKRLLPSLKTVQRVAQHGVGVGVCPGGNLGFHPR